MQNLVIQNIVRAIALLLLQILVLNNIYLGSSINPFLFILIIMMLPTSTPKIAMLFISFACGLIIDIFSNVPGLHAFSCTLLGFCRITFLDKILIGDGSSDIDTPSCRSAAKDQWFAFMACGCLIYNFAYFLLEMFSFHDLWRIILSTVASSVVVILLSILLQTLFIRSKTNS